MRIVGGRLRGRALLSPRDRATRPTSDRVREALFNILAHGIADFSFAGVRVLDLFAGTGALGIEALSRGAAYCLFVEASAETRGLIRENVETLSLIGQTRIYRRDATALGPVGSAGTYALAFADPPYGKGLAERALGAARHGGWLAPGAIAVVEESAVAGFAAPEHFTTISRRIYGDTEVVVLRFERDSAG
mgnify:CR=1 FL=1